MKTLGERIRFIRGEESQAEFAERVGIAKGSIGGYENGRNSPSADVILKICLSYDISSEWLLKGEGSMHIGATSASSVCKENQEKTSQDYSNIEKKIKYIRRGTPRADNRKSQALQRKRNAL